MLVCRGDLKHTGVMLMGVRAGIHNLNNVQLPVSCLESQLILAIFAHKIRNLNVLFDHNILLLSYSCDFQHNA